MDAKQFFAALNDIDEKHRKAADRLTRETSPRRRRVKTVFRGVGYAAATVVLLAVFGWIAFSQQWFGLAGNTPVAQPAAESTPVPDYPAYVGEHVTVTLKEIQRESAFEETLTGSPVYEWDVLRTLALPKLLAMEAEAAGLPNRDEDFEAFADEYEQTLRSNPSFTDNWYRLEHAYHMTMEEYFQYIRTSLDFRISWYGNTYVTYLKEQFENGEAPRLHNGKLPLTWEEYYTEYQEQLYRSENFRYVASDQPTPESQRRKLAQETLNQLVGIWAPLAGVVCLGLLVLGILKRWKVFACCVAYLMVWLALSLLWVAGPANGAFGMSLITAVVFFIAGVVLGVIAARDSFKAYLVFLLFVTVLISFYPDFSHNTLMKWVWHDPRGPFFFDIFYLILGLLSAGLGAMGLNPRNDGKTKEEPPKEK